MGGHRLPYRRPIQRHPDGHRQSNNRRPSGSLHVSPPDSLGSILTLLTSQGIITPGSLSKISSSTEGERGEEEEEVPVESEISGDSNSNDGSSGIQNVRVVPGLVGPEVPSLPLRVVTGPGLLLLTRTYLPTVTYLTEMAGSGDMTRLEVISTVVTHHPSNPTHTLTPSVTAQVNSHKSCWSFLLFRDLLHAGSYSQSKRHSRLFYSRLDLFRTWIISKKKVENRGTTSCNYSHS